jgi:hypothetical protein
VAEVQNRANYSSIAIGHKKRASISGTATRIGNGMMQVDKGTIQERLQVARRWAHRMESYIANSFAQPTCDSTTSYGGRTSAKHVLPFVHFGNRRVDR